MLSVQESPPLLPLAKWVKENLTPEDIVFGAEFDWEPYKIHPDEFPTFDSLLFIREEIRNLRCLPVKWPKDRSFYKEHREEFIEKIVSRYKKHDIIIAENLFKDALPLCSQFICWMRDKDITQDEISVYLADFMSTFDLSTSDVIFYERPFACNKQLIRGTVKDYRHCHILIRSVL